MFVKIQTPISRLLEAEVSSITLSTESGVIQVLPRHQDLLTKLKVGVVKVVVVDKAEKTFLLNSGLVRVQNSVVEITSVDGYEITDKNGKNNSIESYKVRMTEKSILLQEAVSKALNNREYYIQNYLFEEERLAKFELLQELLKGD